MADDHGMATAYHLIRNITQWHHDRNLIDGATDKDQLAKLIQEMGELSDNVCKGKDVADDIGDMIVVLINIAERNGLTIEDCLDCLLYTSPSPRDATLSRMPSSA